MSVSIHRKTNYSRTYWFKMIIVCSELFRSTVWAEFSYSGFLCSKEYHLVFLIHTGQLLHRGYTAAM